MKLSWFVVRMMVAPALAGGSGCSLLADFNPGRVEGGAGMGGSGGIAGSGGTGGAGGTDASVDGPADAHPDAHRDAAPDAMVDASIDAGCNSNLQCDDGNMCTLNICQNGTCHFPTRSCDDLIMCTLDGCEPATGCTHTPNDSLCGDNVACTIDVCDVQQGCLHMPDNALCDDGNPCTIDTCIAPSGGVGGGCVHTPIVGCRACGSDSDCRFCERCTQPNLSRACMSTCGINGVCGDPVVCGSCMPVCP